MVMMVFRFAWCGQSLLLNLIHWQEGSLTSVSLNTRNRTQLQTHWLALSIISCVIEFRSVVVEGTWGYAQTPERVWVGSPKPLFQSVGCREQIFRKPRYVLAWGNSGECTLMESHWWQQTLTGKCLDVITRLSRKIYALRSPYLSSSCYIQIFSTFFIQPPLFHSATSRNS